MSQGISESGMMLTQAWGMAGVTGGLGGLGATGATDLAASFGGLGGHAGLDAGAGLGHGGAATLNELSILGLVATGNCEPPPGPKLKPIY